MNPLDLVGGSTFPRAPEGHYAFTLRRYLFADLGAPRWVIGLLGRWVVGLLGCWVVGRVVSFERIMKLTIQQRRLIGIGAINGFLSVALGAFGAHLLKDRLSADMLAVFQTGVHYHQIHSLALMLLG